MTSTGTKGSYLPKHLPLLPGNVMNMQFQESRFHKSHHFDFSNDVPVYQAEKPPIGGQFSPETARKLSKTQASKYPVDPDAEKLPAWVAFDRQVLCFHAYFQEAVHEKREEKFRVHKCIIYFYLEDDSVQVIEPKVANSGIPQGTLINRHRVPLPEPDLEGQEYFSADHFNVGKEVTFYSRTFRITDCDEFTRNFLIKLGVKPGAAEPTPEDPYTQCRTTMLSSMRPKRPYERNDTLKQFLDNNRKVLRFYCMWDDSSSVFGDAREMTLHYFLADDTIEIRETIPANSGRDAVPQFLKRQKMPRNFEGLQGPGGRVTEFYTDKDLSIGNVLNIFGRKFVLCDCDDFTKNYYSSKFGIQDFQPIVVRPTQQQATKRHVPPYNGFGSEEDSLGSCVSLVPKPPRKDFNKLMQNDNMVLRFSGRMDTARPIDADRKFIISFFLADDTILVFEPRQRNSGIVGGKFLERMRLKRPGTDEYYKASDLFVGATVEFMRHRFILHDADEYAVSYMEAHPEQFDQSNVGAVAVKLQNALAQDQGMLEQFHAALSNFDQDANGFVPLEVFEKACADARTPLTGHEAKTLSRALDIGDGNATYVEMLKRFGFIREGAGQGDAPGAAAAAASDGAEQAGVPDGQAAAQSEEGVRAASEAADQTA